MAGPDPLDRVRGHFDRALHEVRADREHGASWLARRVANAVASAISDVSLDRAPQAIPILHGALREFASARPSMAAVANAAASIWRAGVAAPDAASRLAAIAGEARHLVESDEAWQRSLFEAALPLLTGPVYTLSRSASVERLLIAAAQARPAPLTRVYVGVSQPGGEGIATARALAAAGLQVTLVADAAVGLFVAEAALALVGADSVRADASVVNKVGTYPLALAAREAGVPFYVACETLKIAAPDFPLHFEEMDTRELLAEPIPNVAVRNVYFDRTPPALVAGIITERGILRAPMIGEVADAAGQALTLLRDAA